MKLLKNREFVIMEMATENKRNNYTHKWKTLRKLCHLNYGNCVLFLLRFDSGENKTKNRETFHSDTT